MGFQSILEKYRAYSFSEKDKGTRFERLMQAYLKTEPLYKDRFKHVWLWSDFPFRKDFGGKDTGIDLVAQTTEGDFWAVQCKCYAEDTYIDKPEVDSFLSTSSKLFSNDKLQQVAFSHRLWISTTNKWGSEAENTIKQQNPPVHRISLFNLEASPVDWESLEQGVSGDKARTKRKELFEHQKIAVDKFHEHFRTADRGKLIMACGTGKTFTSLKIAETETKGKGLILFLVPSISLLGQILREWSAESEKPLNAICICSDSEVSRKKTQHEDTDGYSVVDLALPASTNVPNIVRQFHIINESSKSGMTVVFSTYQSIGVIAEAQQKLNREKAGSCIFDLIICDEAHRTTGVTLKDEEESAFVRVHDNDFLKAKKRIYMTATPRLYSEDTQKKAKESEAILCSMDDPALYGEEVYRIGFGESVEKNLLSDYKVLVLTINDDQIPEALLKAVSDPSQEINTDDASKLIGCINALSKRMLVDAELLIKSDPSPMRRAVAFCQNIKISKKIKDIFNTQKDAYYESLTPEQRAEVVTVESQHIDGTMGASIRDDKLSWLKSVPEDGKDSRILTNVRCLSEGVDVPSLDAVMFLSPRNSQIEVVQSVGRVMRTSLGKKYGYIIIPVVIPANVSAEEALDDNERFKVVWTVLNALRAHDDRFNAMINKLELNKNRPSAKSGGGTVLVGGTPDHQPDGSSGGDANGNKPSDSGLSEKLQKQFTLKFEQLQSVIYARMVKKVGDKRYWEQWAASVGDIAKRHIERINSLTKKNTEHQKAFEKFLSGLRKNINPSVSQSEAVEMLAQHIITKPVFEALFENYSFVKSNPISVSMQKMVDLLEEQALEKDQEILEKFYESVKMRVSGIDNAEARQRIIVELYDKFFRTAFPKVVERLGIVYTPVEVVDFIIHSVADVLKKEFDRSLSDENVHIIDPFVGTGTFITRLLQSGHISTRSLEQKYANEIHANEIILLAYYIASINIENVYHDLSKTRAYKGFQGICLTDTFQLGESDEGAKLFSEIFPQNSERVISQKKAPLRVIIGNPPYSIGQKRANDNAPNQDYPHLDSRIAQSYVLQSDSTNKNRVYDSYIRAFRWASDRLDPLNGGVIAFVSNGGWLDSGSGSGFRKCIEKEFDSIIVFDLRGDQRTSGERSRQEGGKIFGSGSRAPIAITLLIRNPKAKAKEPSIKYHDIGDYLSREEKLSLLIKYGDIFSPEIQWKLITPNSQGDWLSKRNVTFQTYIPIAPKEKYDYHSRTYFIVNSIGLNTNRDSWVYNSSRIEVLQNAHRMIDYYNEQVKTFKAALGKNPKLKAEDFIDYSSKEISWTSSLIPQLQKSNYAAFQPDCVSTALYRPFFKQAIYFGEKVIHRRGQFHDFFPTHENENLIICVSGIGGNKTQSTIIGNCMIDLNCLDAGTQCFPLYYYEKSANRQSGLFDESAKEDHILREGVSDFIVERAREQYGNRVTKEDIFYYVYGFLHSPDYHKLCAADLKKMLPRIPFVDLPKDFWAFSKAGRELAHLHINYEAIKPHPLTELGSKSSLIVDKMRFPNKADKSRIIYNNTLTLEGIPEEAYRYVVNGKSAIEWVMDRYRVTVNKDSNIKNDPNDWCKEQNNPRYIVDLVKRVVTVSLETVRIVKGLPKWSPSPSTNATEI